VTTEGTTTPAARPWLRWVSIAAVALVVGGIVGWAVATVFTPPKDVLSSTAFTTVDVVNGEVGSSLTLNTVASWTPVPVGSNLASGVVTSVKIKPGDEVKQGSVLYTVNLRPVVVAKGAVPAFRGLGPGDSGEDVSQLQRMLKTAGHSRAEATGTFDAVTTAAVRAWQKSRSMPVDGFVQAGDIIYVPTLPTRVALDATLLSRGVSLAGGEKVLTGLPSAPEFTVPVTDAQAASMPTGTRVEITSPEGAEWEGFVADQRVDEQNAISIVLAGKDGASICGKDCGQIGVEGQAFLLSKIVTVESVTGLMVPSAALLSKADGTIAVTDPEGVEHPVTVVTSAKGMSIIEGVDDGLSVRVPATEK